MNSSNSIIKIETRAFANSTSGQSVFDVYTKAQGTALDGAKYIRTGDAVRLEVTRAAAQRRVELPQSLSTLHSAEYETSFAPASRKYSAQNVLMAFHV
jgi:hypothetical protein